MIDVEGWAELRREHFVRGVSIRELARRSGLSRNTVRHALPDRPPAFRCPERPSLLDPFKEEIHRLLRDDPKLPAVRVLELIEPLGFEGRQTIVNKYVREVRPLYLPRPRTFQRTSYRAGELLQFDLWEPAHEIPVGHGQTRKGYVVICCLGYSRAGAAALVFSKQAPELLAGISRCLCSLGGVPKLLVWDRQSGLHAGAGQPTREFAAFCGQLKLGWYFCEARDPQAKGVVERLQGYAETNFEPGRRFANELDFQAQLDDWFDQRANRRMHRTLRCRPADRLSEELAQMAALPAELPAIDRRFVIRLPADPHVRVDTNDYSLDPALVGRRVEVRVSQTEVIATALDTGELAARHRRSFARHRTITALEHARALKERGGEPAEPEVERRPLARYDALIA